MPIFAKDVHVQHIIDTNTCEIFKWLLTQSISQIEEFSGIVKMIVALYYGDMKQSDNQEMCLKNLVVSEIFKSNRLYITL